MNGQENNLNEIRQQLRRIADALEKSNTRGVDSARNVGIDLTSADAFVWAPQLGVLNPVAAVNCIPLQLLQGIDQNQQTLLENTQRFVNGLPANNALLWGARGTGKSSLVKSIHDHINKNGNKKGSNALKLIEIHREDIPTLPDLMNKLRGQSCRCILFCDDLSFGKEDTTYKSLKAVLEGGIEGRPDNVILYATSNRRHLMPRDMSENERATAIHPSESVEENVSLSDRFGLWLGFHKCSQDDYLKMVEGYTSFYGLKVSAKEVRAQAIAWSAQRGARSGRVAWQFIQDLAGRLGQTLDVSP